MRNKVSIATLALVAIAGSALADKIYDTSIAAFVGPSSGTARSGSYTTGFEAGEGFAIGGLPQNGWTEFSATPNAASVSGAHPAGGSQHFRIEKDTGASSGSLSGGFSPDMGVLSPGRYILSVDFASNDVDGADYDIVPQAPSQAFLSARMKFSWTGDILILDDLGLGLSFIDTGVDWIADGAYRNVVIDMDSNADTIDYYYNGSLIYSSVTGVVAGTSFEQVVLISDNFQNGGWGDFDNLSVVPAPGALALLGLGGAFASRRRR